MQEATADSGQAGPQRNRNYGRKLWGIAIYGMSGEFLTLALSIFGAVGDFRNVTVEYTESLSRLRFLTLSVTCATVSDWNWGVDQVNQPAYPSIPAFSIRCQYIYAAG
jgi:hypothetical protein